MKPSQIVRLSLWIAWTVYTVILGFYWKFPEGVIRLLSRVIAWLSNHPLEVATMIWCIITVVLSIGLALKLDRDSWATKQLEKIRHSRERDSTYK